MLIRHNKGGTMSEKACSKREAWIQIEVSCNAAREDPNRSGKHPDVSLQSLGLEHPDCHNSADARLS